MDATPSTPASSDLSQYGALLRRRWWVVVAVSVIGLAIGGALLVTRPKVYTSAAQILIKDPSDPTSNGKKINLDTEVAVMKSQQVAVRAKALLRSDESPTRLPRHIEVTAIPNSSVLAVSYNASSPAAAQQGAHLYAQAYLQNRIEQVKNDISRQIAGYRAQIVNLDKQQKALIQQMLEVPGTSQDRQRQKAEVTRIQNQMEKFGERVVELDGAIGNPGQIISDARLGVQTAPIMPLYLGSGFMIGLLFGVLAALWRDRADRRIRRAEDIERLLNLPVLLNVPVKGRNPMGLLPARSQGGQAFHELAHSLNAILGHGNHVILVAGVTPGWGAGAICANLAAALARTDDDVVLVCANLPSPYSARLLNLNEGPGLSEILVHGTSVSDVVQAPRELPRMRVITPGHDEDLAWERLQTQSMDRLIQGLRRHATHVIIEAPPTSTSADAQALAEVADVSIIVAEIPRAEREHVGEGMRQLDRMGTAVLGAVVLPVQPGTVPPPAASRSTSRRRDGSRVDAARMDAARMEGVTTGRADADPADAGRMEPRRRRHAAPDPLVDDLYEDAGQPPPYRQDQMPPAQLSSAQLSSAQPPAPAPHRGRPDGRSGLAGYADMSADPYGDEGGAGRSAGGGKSAAELFPPETFKTESFEAADRTQAFDAIDDLVAGAADDDAFDPGRVGDR
ncbi:MAG TPA: Wzz/FepE/Etk N-terminal domain-containing protein [Streptosporangiaceae bacterium]|nr:Wzz/FepE/Etk N-terminal domain-containing protein [Streptosporangiaceae bacterium]